MAIQSFYMPKTLEEARKLLQKEGNIILGGGTHLSVNMPQNTTGLISLKKLGLDRIMREKNIYIIGAQVVLSDIIKHKEFLTLWNGIFYKASRNAGSTLNKNLITVGGNIVKVLYWSDLPPVLLILDGRVIDDMGEKIPFDIFFDKHPTALKFGKDRIVTSIEIDIPSQSNFTYFWESFQKTKVDFALVTICGGVCFHDEIIKDIKLSVGAISLLPKRLKKAENILLGKKPTLEIFREAFSEEFKDFRFKYDYRSSKEYIMDITQNLFQKNILKIQEGFRNADRTEH